MIINVFQRRTAQDTSTFICRVLYEILRQHELTCFCDRCTGEQFDMRFALRWSLEVCHIYISSLDVPALVSRIHYFNHTAKLIGTNPTRQSLEDHVIKYSSYYLHHKERGKLSKMSSVHDQWRMDDEIDSQVRMHYLYLMHLHVYIEASGEQCDDWDFQKVLARKNLGFYCSIIVISF